MNERKCFSISELAEALHLPELESAWTDEKTQILPAPLSDRFNIYYEPMMLPCTDWKTPGWPQTLKKAFEIAVQEKDSAMTPISLYYREDSPGCFRLDGTGFIADRALKEALRRDPEPAVREIADTVFRNSPFGHSPD